MCEFMEPYEKEDNELLEWARSLSQGELKEGIVNSQNLLNEYKEIQRMLSEDFLDTPEKEVGKKTE